MQTDLIILSVFRMQQLFFFFLCVLFSIVIEVISIKEGPCTLGTHSSSRNLTCTQNGYFDLVQCPAGQNYCVCVDPSNGHEAVSTRTTTNKVSPQCGKCHVLTAQMFNTPMGIVLKPPQCQSKSGQFQKKQCLGDLKCWCVDPASGKRVNGTFETANSELNCDQLNLDFSLDSTRSALANNEAKPDEPDFKELPVGSPACKLEKDSGKVCSNSPVRLQWYFDMDSFECLAFKHNGCGGNDNKFDSVSECWSTCKLADMGGCAGMRPAAKNQKGESIICSQAGNESSIGQCPTGYRCSMMAFFGICCHIETQELYKRNYQPVCENGKTLQKLTSGGVPMTLIGKSCEDQFCPANTVCHKKEVFAHCCSK